VRSHGTLVVSMPFLRRRFRDLVERQLDLFADDQEHLLRELAEARERERRAGADEVEEAFGDWHDRVEWLCDELWDLRDRYAATLDEGTAREYRRAFLRAARRRFPVLAPALEAEARLDEE
jgi:hypothetical protein